MAVKRRKFKLPTAKQLHQALPFVSAGLSVLSTLPNNRKIRQALTTAATVTGGLGQPSTFSVKEQLRAVLEELKTAPPEKMSELTLQALTLAQLLVNEK